MKAFYPVVCLSIFLLILPCHADSNGGVNCAVCDVLLGLAEQTSVIHNETIVHSLERLCNYLPDKYRKACQVFVEVLGPVLIQILEDGDTPDVLCHKLGFCFTEKGRQCTIFPVKEKRKLYHYSEDPKLTKKVKGVYMPKIGADICTLPGIKDICDWIKLIFNNHEPAVDLDGDKHSSFETLRGYSWRGKDCNDDNRGVHPGARALNQDIDIDSNCNGIKGLDTASGVPYETEYCAGSMPRGVAVLGDSISAHFHIPPQWLNSTELSLAVFEGLPYIAENELDWPAFSYGTGFMNATDTLRKVIDGRTDSLYLRLWERNRCNFRDYQNIAVNVFNPRLNKDIAVREQYPLKLGFGLTIHKAQGMTLSSVEVDCREIFRPGQLGVAISRATSSNGLRILNFHPRYVIPPPQTVVDFMKGPSKPILPDLDCCQHLKSPSAPNTPQDTSQTVQLTPVQSISHDDDMGFEETDEENLDDDFNKIIECIAKGEAEAVDFEIPAQFNIDKVLKDASFEKEVTESHTKINAIINRLDPQKLSIFIKKLFLKVGEFVSKLTSTKASGQGIPEKHLVQYIQLVHEFSNSTEYKLSCLILFETEDKCLENQMIVCDCVLEAVRGHYLKEKVVLMSTTGGQLPKRDITNASRARIRYVAGYCLASVRKKYSKIKSSNIYAQTNVAQQSYEEAKGILGILNKVKEEESFLQQTSTEKDSLLDVERRQFASKGLTNVTDSFYFFYISLTDKLLNILIYEKLMEFGKDLMNECTKAVNNDTILYEHFVKVVSNAVNKDSTEEFDETNDIKSMLDSIVSNAANILKLYDELTQKYIMVLLNQFRKDMKMSLKVQKTMAHRKQIRVSSSKSPAKKTKITKSGKQNITGTSKPKKSVQIAELTDPAEAQLQMAGPSGKQKITGTSKPKKSVQIAELTDPAEAQLQMAGPSGKQKITGTSKPKKSVQIAELTDPAEAQLQMAGPSDDPSLSSDEEMCAKCNVDKDDLWIQCDSCNLWFHRNCAGLRNASKWIKMSKEGAEWLCKDCT